MFSVLPFVSASPAEAVVTPWDTTGNYTVAFEYGGTYLHDMTLVQNGLGMLSGSGGNPAGGAHVYTWVITSGSVVGNTIDFYANYTASADAVTPQTTMHVIGTIAPSGAMSGTWTDNYQGGNRSGTWSTTAGTATVVPSTTVVVSGNTSAGENMPGWLFNRDVNTSTPFTFNTVSPSIGSGSLYVLPIGANPSDKFIGENFINAMIADVDFISYDFRIGTSGVATQKDQFYMNVYANFGVSPDTKFYDCRYNVVPTVGSTAGFTTVTFDPTQAYPVTQSGTSPFTCPSVPAQMDTLSASSTIRVFALNLGDSSTSDTGLDGYFDNVVVAKTDGVTVFDFDPAPAPVMHTLTTVLAGTGTGSVTSIPAGISCGVDCTESYLNNTVVTLTATPATGSTFTGWSGACSGTGSCAVTLSSAKTVTATFTLSTVVVGPPTDKDQCKKDGWKTFNNPSFKNQGQCVSYTNHN